MQTWFFAGVFLRFFPDLAKLRFFGFFLGFFLPIIGFLQEVFF